MGAALGDVLPPAFGVAVGRGPIAPGTVTAVLPEVLGVVLSGKGLGGPP